MRLDVEGYYRLVPRSAQALRFAPESRFVEVWMTGDRPSDVNPH
jgi:hypothetical protein